MKVIKHFLIAGVLMAFFVLRSSFANSIKANETYAIQNADTELDLRPFEAQTHDGNKVIQYNHHWWKCLTWKFIPAGSNSYFLTNYYTEKALNLSQPPKAGVGLLQRPFLKDKTQKWEFIDNGKGYFKIRLEGKDLYLTSVSKKNNAELEIQPSNNSKNQLWKLINQSPLF